MAEQLATCRVIACASNWDKKFPDVPVWEVRKINTGMYAHFPSRRGRWRDGWVKFHFFRVDGHEYGFCDDCVKQVYLNQLSLLGRASD